VKESTGSESKVVALQRKILKKLMSMADWDGQRLEMGTDHSVRTSSSLFYADSDGTLNLPSAEAWTVESSSGAD
jgi:hypothetical protein